MTDMIKKEKVVFVYSGKPGCCCGCKGKYYYRENKELRAAGVKHRGYEVDDHEVNEKMITRVINKMNKHIDKVEEIGDILSLDIDNRVYLAYLVS